MAFALQVIGKAQRVTGKILALVKGIRCSNNADVIRFNLLTQIFELIVLSDGYLIRISAQLATEAIIYFD